MALDIPAGWGQIPLEAKPLDLGAVYSDASKVEQLRAGTAESLARSRQLEAEAPGVAAEAQDKVAQAPAIAAGAQLQTAAAQDAMIARAASQVDPDDPDAAAKWDAAYQKLVDRGVDSAKQFIGKYSPKAARRIAQGYAAPSPAAAALVNGEGGMPAAGGSAGQEQQLAQQVSQMTPAQIQEASQHATTIKSALEKVFSSPDPAAEWDRQAAAIGYPQLAGHYSYLNAQDIYARIKPVATLLQDRQMQSQTGLPPPPIGGEVKEAGGALYGITPGPTGPQAKSLTPAGDWSLVGTNADGKGVYINNKTGEEHVGDNPLSAKPGTTGGGARTFDLKRQAWLDVHPGDAAGALEFAGGHKSMAPAQAQEAAAAQAARDLAAMAQSGQPPADPQGFLRQATAEHFAELTAAASPPAGGGGGGGAPPAPADANAANRISMARSYATAAQAAAAGGPRAGHAQTQLERVQADALKLPPMADPGVAPPPRAVAQLKEGQVKVFNNGTGWSLKNGKPVRLW